MSAAPETYVDLDGTEFVLSGLDRAERKLFSSLREHARTCPEWNAFDNWWLPRVVSFYEKRGLTRSQIVLTPLFRIAEDLSGRIGIATGMCLPDDYVSDLEWLIRDNFKTRRDFCKATGLSEDMLSHVLAGRKHLAIDTLTKALARIGYRLRIVKQPVMAKAAKKRLLAQ
jgi:hypothetical protein